MSSRANSSMVLKSRQQPRPEDIQFLQFLNRVRSSGKPVLDYGDVGTWQERAEEINAAAENNRAEDTIKSLAKIDRRIAEMLARIPATDQDQAAEQEPLHPDFRIGKQGKKVFKTLSEDDIES